ncbi:hypothetical protein [Komagataeibacter sp. FXV3]|uniref:hypothetical protein n=1 Tax=Komagataeibacter sp. FXV3 TaxID=2608998 RepID=UPI00187B3604|nr:hypothetical protein [Komagataeibacter sp. FXV3]MBE7728737.1 hypothetical protein [Komagataeibacter sp. FXV3]
MGTVPLIVHDFPVAITRARSCAPLPCSRATQPYDHKKSRGTIPMPRLFYAYGSRPYRLFEKSIHDSALKSMEVFGKAICGKLQKERRFFSKKAAPENLYFYKQTVF